MPLDAFSQSGATEVLPGRATFHTLNTKLYNRVIHKRVLRHVGIHGQVRQSLGTGRLFPRHAEYV